MVKLLIFDVDGVFNKEELLAKARKDKLFKALSDKLKISRNEAERKYYETKKSLPPEKKYTSTYIFMELGFTRKDYFKILNQVDQAELIMPYENCENMLKAISKDNVIVTLSNTPRKSSIETLKILKIDKYIKKAYSAEDFNESKPSADIFKKILDDMNFKPEDVIVIGNSMEKEILPAHKLGMKTILFDPRGYYNKPKEADFIITDLIEILDLV